MPWTPNGFVPYTAQQALDVINAIFIDTFGSDVDLTPSGVNGQFINKEANWLLINENAMNMLVTNTYNPSTSVGIWEDAICSFSGINRKAASSSIVICTCYGSSGTVIPQGAQISSANGDVFLSTVSGTIGSGGTIDIQFASQQTGAIPCNANIVNNIITRVYGWDRVNNNADGTLGAVQQTDTSLRNQRTKLLGSYGSCSLASLYSGVYNVPGVTSVFAAENDQPDPLVIGGITLPPISIVISVLGGLDADIATAMYTKKAPGVKMVGNTNVVIPNGFGSTWTATYYRPTATPLRVYLQIGNSAALPLDIATTIKTAVVNNFNGLDPNAPNATAVGINELINTSRFVPSLLALGVSDILINTIDLASGSGQPTSPFIQLNADLIATLSTANVTVVLV